MDDIIEQFAHLKSLPLNSQCADCATSSSINYVSLNNAVFLCSSCALIHQEVFSTIISEIKMIPSTDSIKIKFDSLSGTFTQEEIEAKIE